MTKEVWDATEAEEVVVDEEEEEQEEVVSHVHCWVCGGYDDTSENPILFCSGILAVDGGHCDKGFHL